ncbi:hypothetical protein LCGC14_0299830 [marine sediment metagenome]|uniref:DNA (cytosine-5-)-methyltransferase n=1 Tax=marine sediment metagenome TaxID=412755 RepID=A0A0F9WC23_9ZZZZ
MTYDLTALDLFSGCGGLTQGLKNAGYKVIGAVEINEKARHTYSLNHGDVPLVGTDIKGVNADDLMSLLGINVGELDLLAGCPPCQGFSTMRSRNGREPVADDRNFLIDEFARIAFATMPKMIMMENVPSLAKFERFTDFVERLTKAGYTVIHKVLDVSKFGVPQRRKRLILSASRVGAAALAEDFSGKVTVRDTIEQLPQAGTSGDSAHDYSSPRRSEKVKALIAAIPKDGGSRDSLPMEMRLKCHLRTNGFNDVYGRMRWDEISPTITSGCINPSKGRFLHPEEDRPITLREAALLQGFPVTYKFDISHGKEAISLMIGNALPPPFIAAHGRAMAKMLMR